MSITIFHRKMLSFHFFGVMGYLLGTLLGVVVCYFLNLQVGIILLMTLIGAATFFMLAFVAKIISGEEQIVYYHHEIAILILCSIILKILHLPVLSYMDITILGIATFLAFGRIGCFSVGCCHGRPSSKGVKYGHEHVEDGFPYYLENVRLFPIQLVESGYVFMVIISGVFMLLKHVQPGTVLLFYTVIYGAFRFIVEFFRGDTERPYFKGLSEAQWTTLILLAITLELSLIGFTPFYYWHLITTVCMFTISLVVIINNKKKKNIFNPHHVAQIAQGLMALNNKTNTPEQNTAVTMFQTDLGLTFSKGQFVNKESLITHYTVSYKNTNNFTLKTIEKLAVLIKNMQGHKGPFQITEKQNGVVHILFDEFPKVELELISTKNYASIL